MRPDKAKVVYILCLFLFSYFYCVQMAQFLVYIYCSSAYSTNIQHLFATYTEIENRRKIRSKRRHRYWMSLQSVSYDCSSHEDEYNCI